MSTLQAIILGFIQGFSEFLPISSSGHLAVLQQLFSIKEGNLFFAEMLHFGTLLSIFFVFRKRIKRLIIEGVTFLVHGFQRKKFYIENVYQRIALLILVSCIPAAIAGMFFGDFFESLYRNFFVIGSSFIITGILLYWIDHSKEGFKGPGKLTVADSLVVGLMQAIAIVPGISRSGSTLSGLVLRGVKRNFAAEFAFLMSIPPVLGATILGIFKTAQGISPEFVLNPSLWIGVFVSFFIGVITLKTLINILRRKKLYYFSYYLIPLGILVILLDLLGFIG